MSEIPIHHNQYFYLPGGRALKSLQDLLDELKTMDDAVFAHHVNDHKNDFANWIRGVFKNEKLANKIVSMSSKSKTMDALESEVHPPPSFAGPILRSFPFIKSTAKEISQKEEHKQIENHHAEQQNPTAPQPSYPNPTEKLNDIIAKEKEIEKREEKILEVEQHMEKQLAEIASKRSQKFFTAEFVQGLLIGLLLALIIGLIYLKVYM